MKHDPFDAMQEFTQTLHPSCIHILCWSLKRGVKQTQTGRLFHQLECLKCKGHGLSVSCVKWPLGLLACHDYNTEELGADQKLPYAPIEAWFGRQKSNTRNTTCQAHIKHGPTPHGSQRPFLQFLVFSFSPRHMLAKLAQMSYIRQMCLNVTFLFSLLFLGYGTHNQCMIVSKSTSRPQPHSSRFQKLV